MRIFTATLAPNQCDTKKTFQCVTSRICIPASWKCDGNADCEDKSDESSTICTSHSCPDKHFRCDNAKCILKSWVCDGTDDCGDNSDEDVRHACSKCASHMKTICRTITNPWYLFSSKTTFLLSTWRMAMSQRYRPMH